MTTETEVRWVAVSTLDDLWEDEMGLVEVDGEPILLVHHEGGDLSAYQGMCPHQETALGDADLEDNVITCVSHLWEFNARSGEGINPQGTRLYRYKVKLDGDKITVGIPQDGKRHYNRGSE